jgi:hypothetical protein
VSRSGHDYRPQIADYKLFLSRCCSLSVALQLLLSFALLLVSWMPCVLVLKIPRPVRRH